MSLINEYRSTEAAIKELQERLQSLENNDNLKKELEFESKLNDLMKSYGKSLRDVISILDPAGGKAPRSTTPTSRSPRKIKRFKNPHTGEVIETKGGNHKTLKEWKAKWGGDTVESWAEIL